MELTRRDAVAALASAGIVGGGALAAASRDSVEPSPDSRDGVESAPDAGESEPTPIDDDDLGILVAAAEVLYPSGVEGVETFVETFVRGRAAEDPDHAAGVADAAAYLDEWTNAWFDANFPALDVDRREEALERVGVEAADPDPDGTDVERVRYFVVNELLYALYTSPTGGELVGIENPQGHPGGTGSYQRGPR